MCRPDVDPKLRLGLPNVCDLTAALIQDWVNVCLMGDLQLVLGSHPQKSSSE